MVYELSSALKNILFPSVCFVCEKATRNKVICSDCYKKITFLTPPLCRLCSLPLRGRVRNLCGKCRPKTFYYDYLISILCYKEPIISLLHLFKYRQYEFLKDFFSSLMIEHLATIGCDLSGYDFIVNVPSHALRIKEREYSQTLLLSEAIAHHLKIPLRNSALQCIRHHPSQTKVAPTLRKYNIEGAFSANQEIEGACVLLIDDVITTGATVSECSKVLKKAGARRVSILSLARAG